jgi:hypothetical protein
MGSIPLKLGGLRTWIGKRHFANTKIIRFWFSQPVFMTLGVISMKFVVESPHRKLVTVRTCYSSPWTLMSPLVISEV